MCFDLYCNQLGFPSNDGMDKPEQDPVRGGVMSRSYESMTVQEPHPSFRRRDHHQDHSKYTCAFIFNTNTKKKSHVTFCWLHFVQSCVCVCNSAFLLIRPFNQKWSNNQKRHCPPPLFPTPPYRASSPLIPTPPFRGPPPLLPTPPLWGAQSGLRASRYPVPPPNPAFLPLYRMGEEPRHKRHKKRRTAHKRNPNSPCTHWLNTAVLSTSAAFMLTKRVQNSQIILIF